MYVHVLNLIPSLATGNCLKISQPVRRQTFERSVHRALMKLAGVGEIEETASKYGITE